MANLATALFTHGRIETTLPKAKALRPFAEKIITLAKKAKESDDRAKALHYRRMAIARVRDNEAVKNLFDVRVDEFMERNGGYTRIYKLMPRRGDAAEMALIELIDASDEGYTKPKRKVKKKAKKSAARPVAEAGEGNVAVAETEEAAEKAQAETADEPQASADGETTAASAEASDEAAPTETEEKKD